MNSRPSFTFLATVAVLIMLAVTSCGLPQWRIFQAKIDPKLAEKPGAQIEAERQAAVFIRDTSATLAADPARQVAKIHAVAVPLANSLGEPLQAVRADDSDRIIAELRAGKLAEQEKAEKWKAFAQKYAGKPIEDTGINLAGPAGLVGLVLVVAACVACPAIGFALLRVIPVLWGYFRRTTEAIGEFAASHPDAGEKLAAKLSTKMDAAHKRLVKKRAHHHRIPRSQVAHA